MLWYSLELQMELHLEFHYTNANLTNVNAFIKIEGALLHVRNVSQLPDMKEIHHVKSTNSFRQSEAEG